MLRLLVCLSLFAAASPAGLLVLRSEGGLQFADATSMTINGKDKARSLGAQARIVGPIGRLPSVRLGGTLVMVRDSRTVALYQDGAPVYLLPDGLPKDAAGEPGALWETVRITYRKSQSEKTPVETPVASFVAYLPGGVADLARLCMDEDAMLLLGGKGKGFAMQLELLASTIAAYGTDPAAAILEKYVEDSMRLRYERFENGLAGVDVLQQGLHLAALSQAVYPQQSEQQKLRQALTARKQWLDRKIAVLRAFAAGGQWDALLLGDRDFQTYLGAYPEMAQKHRQALQESLRIHRQAGQQRMADGEFGAAYREFRLASSRQPSDSGLQKQVAVAWVEYSRRVAVDHQSRRKQLSVGQRETITQTLHFATRYKEERKLDEALKSVAEAESIDRESLPVLLKKAEILGERRETAKALATLDEYDLRAIDAEREPANRLRNELLFQLTNNLKELKGHLADAWAAMSFLRARELAAEGLRAKDDDPDLLYNAGLAAFITRQPNEARQLFDRYLEVSDTLDGDAGQRARVRRLLPAIVDEPGTGEGEANWLSGQKLPKGVFYCPISMAFQPRVDRIEGSDKLRMSFEWEAGRLKSISSSVEKDKNQTWSKKIFFSYDDRVPQVTVAAEDQVPSAAPADPDERLKQASVVLPNQPDVDPLAVRKLLGRDLALGIAGNRFFNPFVWEKIYYFQFTYDEQGRVRQARELQTRGGAPGDTLLEFEWSGQQLSGIRGFQIQGTDGKNRAPIYERNLRYQDGLLVSEEVNYQGKSSRIRYSYNGERLVAANCDKESAPDGHSRQVTFLPPAQAR